ncbi:methyltransferase, putative [hydrothermal vent metagenome]|uniref:Methyltransferase, putative n=1 Tax=hydrothermal vent metagenome TaxID=652676 RepID=A0A1W1BBP0_9ZZZZ
MKKDHFAHKSKSWDMSSKRVKNAKSISSSILKNINLSKDMCLMDFGAGTGLLSYFIAPYVETIVAVDNSPSMLEVLRQKSDEFECNIEMVEADLSVEKIDREFDGIISSMTLHHLEDTSALLSLMYDMLKPNGFIALADLDSEDGTFHSDNAGVFHFGFDRDILFSLAKDVGFKDIVFETVSTISKPHRDFDIFLMIAKK